MCVDGGCRNFIDMREVAKTGLDLPHFTAEYWRKRCLDVEMRVNQLEGEISRLKGLKELTREDVRKINKAVEILDAEDVPEKDRVIYLERRALMPYKIKKVKGGYQTSGPSGVHAKKTSLKKAKAQIRIMQASEHGFKPTGKKKIGR